MGTLNDNIAEYLRKTKKVATAYFVCGNIGGLYPSWAWGTLLCSNDNTANFIGIANRNKTAAFAHYENGAWEKVPVESLSNLTTTNKSSLVGAINELNSNRLKEYNWRAYDDIISAMNAEKEAILIQGSSVFAAATNGGHPYMIILSVPESRDAIGVYVDYFKPTVTAFRYKNDSFEIII